MNKNIIIENLNTISNIKQYQKFYYYNNCLYIEYNDILQFARRWVMGRNRYDSFLFIRKIFNNSFDIIDNLIKEYFCTNKNKENIINNIIIFYKLYNNSIVSLNHIQKTYSNDSKIISEIYILKNEIQLKLNKILDINIIKNES